MKPLTDYLPDFVPSHESLKASEFYVDEQDHIYSDLAPSRSKKLTDITFQMMKAHPDGNQLSEATAEVYAEFPRDRFGAL